MFDNKNKHIGKKMYKLIKVKIDFKNNFMCKSQDWNDFEIWQNWSKDVKNLEWLPFKSF